MSKFESDGKCWKVVLAICSVNCFSREKTVKGCVREKCCCFRFGKILGFTGKRFGKFSWVTQCPDEPQ